MNIYLAGGMKTGWQDRYIDRFKNFNFIDPRSHGLTDEKEYTGWDLDGIRRSDLVIAYMDTLNPSGFGLSLEVGFAKALNIPIHYVCEDNIDTRQIYFGMVRACATKVFFDIEDSFELLETYKEL